MRIPSSILGAVIHLSSAQRISKRAAERHAPLSLRLTSLSACQAMMLVEHCNLAADRHDLADQYFQGGARLGWQSALSGKCLLRQLREVGSTGVGGEAQRRQSLLPRLA